MNMMMVLMGMCLFCGIVAIYVGSKNAREVRRRPRGRSVALAGAGQAHARGAAAGGKGPVQRTVMVAVGLSACLLFACQRSEAQEVVHAVSGDVVAVSAAARTITLKTDDGSLHLFKDGSGSQTAVSLDKTMQAQTVPVAGFSQVGAHVVVLYYGFGDLQTAVAIKDLGASAPSKMAGSVAEFDHHQHVLTLKGDSSQAQKVALAEQTVVDTPDGVVDGLKFHPSKGQHLGVITKAGSGSAVALFVSAS